jgi:lactam utilization protein B
MCTSHDHFQVVDRYLKPDGVFYEVLSEDRDGVGAFVEAIKALGFTVEVVSAPDKYYRAFNTRTWSQQQAERYRLFAFRRAACRHASLLSPAGVIAVPELQGE